MPTSRSYWQIFSENVFTFINLCILGLGIALAVLGRVLDALTYIFVISLNIVVSVVQEIRAKRTLDRIALLARPLALVVRDGRELEIAPDELVVDDIIKVGPGDQILVDGRIISDARVTVDESLLTGESDPAIKSMGEPVFSGTYCVTGTAYYRAERVGGNSLAHQMTATARAFRRVLTPLQRQINLVIRIALLIVGYMELLLVMTSVLQRINLADSVENAAIVAGLVPNGLFLSIAVAYALGAIRILRFGALVQQSNAIESLSHVDVLCLDKTGTLTANRLRVVSISALAMTDSEFGRLLGTMAASMHGSNKTTEAVRAAWPGAAIPLAGEVPFSSARAWSAVAFEGAADQTSSLSGVYALGAPEVLLQYLRKHEPVTWPTIIEQVHALAAQGLRVLLVARATGSVALEDLGDASVLPPGMEPLGLLALGDELRPEARETLSAFTQAGVQLKLISGDSPETVAALALQAGLPPDLKVVSGPELERMSEADMEAVAESTTIFGRIAPQQKERLIRALRQRGHYVAMIGDGANDVLSLKQADLGIAMQSGSQAARGVADVVLLQDSFAVLVPALAEGQRILNGMQDILKLFLARISTIGMVILSSLVVGTFPLELRQGSLVTFFSVGVPAIILAIWAQPGAVSARHLMRRLLHFILPPVLLTSTMGLIVFVGSYALHLIQSGAFAARNPSALIQDDPVAQTMLTAFLVCCGLLLVIFVEPPTTWWVGGNAGTGDRRPALLAAGMLAAFVGVMLVPPLRGLFALAALGPQESLLLGLALTIWVFATRAVWRSRLLDRYLNADLS